THGGKPGTKWSEASLFTAYVRGGVNTQTDEAPDAGGVFSSNGASCPGGAAAPPPAPAPTDPAPTAPAPPSGGPTAPATQPSGALRISVAPTTLKARKVKRARRIAFNLRPSESMSSLVITFKKGSKRLGTAKLAQLQGAKKVALKLRKKGLKKGRYTLAITGKRPDGSTAAAKFVIRVK
ncbi:MAG: hypothetical protein ACLGI3_14600, partial [Actinomycetes bacterium]